MSESIPDYRTRIRNWLGAGIFMVLVQIVLGSITRLSGSGLSITEWKPLMGVFPPLSDSEWRHSFEQYQHIAQFKKLNYHFTLADYQGLFFWEWVHREWARLMGLVFIIPFFIFLTRGKFNRTLGVQLAGLFLLGMLQGLAGWLMVQSGLNDTDVTVSHIRLAVHFCLALFLLSYLFWMFLDSGANHATISPVRPFRNLTRAIVITLGFQLIYGAFMAGTHAALYAPTWPDMNGAIFMSSTDASKTWLHRVIYDPLLIQFIHRSLAYLLCGLFIAWFLLSRPLASAGGTFLNWPPTLLIIQVSLGVFCLLRSGTSLYSWLAVAHQFNGILLLLSMVNVLYCLRKTPGSFPAVTVPDE